MSAPAASASCLACRVDGCTADLSHDKEYCRKHKVCSYHLKELTVPVAGEASRWCQQCAKFHGISSFDGGRRSCRQRLALHGLRSRGRKMQHGGSAAAEGEERALPSSSGSSSAMGNSNEAGTSLGKAQRGSRLQHAGKHPLDAAQPCTEQYGNHQQGATQYYIGSAAGPSTAGRYAGMHTTTGFYVPVLELSGGMLQPMQSGDMLQPVQSSGMLQPVQSNDMLQPVQSAQGPVGLQQVHTDPGPINMPPVHQYSCVADYPGLKQTRSDEGPASGHYHVGGVPLGEDAQLHAGLMQPLYSDEQTPRWPLVSPTNAAMPTHQMGMSSAWPPELTETIPAPKRRAISMGGMQGAPCSLPPLVGQHSLAGQHSLVRQHSCVEGDSQCHAELQPQEDYDGRQLVARRTPSLASLQAAGAQQPSYLDSLLDSLALASHTGSLMMQQPCAGVQDEGQQLDVQPSWQVPRENAQPNCGMLDASGTASQPHQLQQACLTLQPPHQVEQACPAPQQPQVSSVTLPTAASVKLEAELQQLLMGIAPHADSREDAGRRLSLHPQGCRPLSLPGHSQQPDVATHRYVCLAPSAITPTGRPPSVALPSPLHPSSLLMSAPEFAGVSPHSGPMGATTDQAPVVSLPGGEGRGGEGAGAGFQPGQLALSPPTAEQAPCSGPPGSVYMQQCLVQQQLLLQQEQARLQVRQQQLRTQQQLLQQAQQRLLRQQQLQAQLQQVQQQQHGMSPDFLQGLP